MGEDEKAGETAESSVAVAEELLPPVETFPRTGSPERGAGGTLVIAA